MAILTIINRNIEPGEVFAHDGSVHLNGVIGSGAQVHINNGGLRIDPLFASEGDKVVGDGAAIRLDGDSAGETIIAREVNTVDGVENRTIHISGGNAFAVGQSGDVTIIRGGENVGAMFSDSAQVPKALLGGLVIEKGRIGDDVTISGQTQEPVVYGAVGERLKVETMGDVRVRASVDCGYQDEGAFLHNVAG